MFKGSKIAGGARDNRTHVQIEEKVCVWGNYRNFIHPEHGVSGRLICVLFVFLRVKKNKTIKEEKGLIVF